jgi:putative ABC transport system substrate-binding protein
MTRVSRGLALLALAIVAMLALGAVAGCGEKEDSNGGATTGSTSPEPTKTFKVGISQIVSHPALDACVEGFKEAMAEKGFVEGKNVEYDLQNAQGDMATASSIATKFADAGLDLVYTVATPTSQAMVKASTTIPIVFSAVTDPVGAGLVKDGNAPEANVTGVSDMLPIQPHLDLVKAIVPEIKKLGVIYNAGETNSVVLVKAEKEAAKAMGIEIVEATASNSSEVQAAAKSLVGRVDAVSVLTDNTVVSALESVIKVCREAKIPLISGDTDSVKRGSVAAYAFDYKTLGLQAGAVAADILNGKAIKDIPVQYAQDLQLSVNEAAAKAMGVTIPTQLMEKAANKF